MKISIFLKWKSKIYHVLKNNFGIITNYWFILFLNRILVSLNSKKNVRSFFWVSCGLIWHVSTKKKKRKRKHTFPHFQINFEILNRRRRKRDKDQVEDSKFLPRSFDAISQLFFHYRSPTFEKKLKLKRRSPKNAAWIVQKNEKLLLKVWNRWSMLPLMKFFLKKHF